MPTYDKTELSVIFIDTFDFLDYKIKSDIVKRVNGGERISSILESFSDRISKENIAIIKNSENKEYLNNAVSLLNDNGVTAITYYSTNYPKSLKSVYNPPLILYAKGNLDLLKSEKIFAIVGSRKCLPQDKAIAEDYAKTLSSNGITIVTGIAEGIDSSAIKGALKSKNIISVTAGGFDKLYPSTNQDLFDEVAKCGLCLSEQRIGVQSTPYMYPVRNRIIAGLAIGVLVVSASVKSGTMHTVSYALDGGKEVFAIPHAIGVKSGEGTNKMIKAGAFLTDEPQDILAFYDVEQAQVKEEIILTEKENEIYSVIKEKGSVYIDELCVILNKRVFELMPTLSMMEIKGVIIKSADNFYSVV